MRVRFHPAGDDPRYPPDPPTKGFRSDTWWVPPAVSIAVVIAICVAILIAA